MNLFRQCLSLLLILLPDFLCSAWFSAAESRDVFRIPSCAYFPFSRPFQIFPSVSWQIRLYIPFLYNTIYLPTEYLELFNLSIDTPVILHFLRRYRWVFCGYIRIIKVCALSYLYFWGVRINMYLSVFLSAFFQFTKSLEEHKKKLGSYQRPFEFFRRQ